MTHEQVDALVIGAGPSGLMAADVLSAAGHRVILTDAMPSPGRKFLMAGKSGLNLTFDASPEAFGAVYGDTTGVIRDAVAKFGPQEAVAWARGLGQETFVGSSGRVFPVAMKASPLLRAWLARLEAQKVDLRRRWRWRGWADDGSQFDTPDGPRHIRALATVLALGGASWARLGSDGSWIAPVAKAGIKTTDFAASNAGVRVDWSKHMAAHLGQPVKPVAVVCGSAEVRGELMLTRNGLEGGALYAVSLGLRNNERLWLDLAPDLDPATLAARLGKARKGAKTTERLRKAGFDPVRRALFNEFGRGASGTLPDLLKRLPVPYAGLADMDGAISTVGGIALDAIGPDLMLGARPGVFAAGEMLDWDAPTGGYLLTACLATGRRAGRAADRWLASH